MPAWSFEEGCQQINAARNFDDLAVVFEVFFGISKAALESYDDLKSGLDALPENQTALNLYDFYQKWKNTAQFFTKNELLAVPEYAEIVNIAQSVTGKEVKEAIENIGADFVRKNFPNIEDEAAVISRINSKIDPLEKKIREIEFAVRNEVRQKVEEMTNKDYEYKIAWCAYRASKTQSEKKDAYLRMENVRNKYYKVLQYDGINDNEEYKNLMTSLSSIQEERDRCKGEIFQKVTDALLAGTKITREQAMEWVEKSVVFNGAADRRLKDQQNPYSVAELKNDLAELYRYVGGKLGPIEFVARGAKRAWAKGRGHIEIDNNFSKITLFHECGHLIEAWDSAVNAACPQFVKGRATGHPVSLNKLTGIKAYRSNEMAYPDTFIDPYVGKDYGGRSSEVFSMGLQCLASPDALAMLAEKDPEHLRLTLGICLRHNPALEGDIQAEVEQKKKLIEKEERLKAWKKALKKALTKEFVAAVTSDTGIDGYRVKGIGKYGAFLEAWQEPSDDGRSIGKWSVRQLLDKEKDLIPMAYFYIANKRNLLPEWYDNIDYIARRFSSVEIPAWFDPAKPLPRIVV